MSQQAAHICYQSQLTFLCRTRSLYLQGRGMSLEISSQKKELPAILWSPGRAPLDRNPHSISCLPSAPGTGEPGARGACPTQGHTAVTTTSKCLGKVFLLFVT